MSSGRDIAENVTEWKVLSSELKKKIRWKALLFWPSCQTTLKRLGRPQSFKEQSGSRRYRCWSVESYLRQRSSCTAAQLPTSSFGSTCGQCSKCWSQARSPDYPHSAHHYKRCVLENLGNSQQILFFKLLSLFILPQLVHLVNAIIDAESSLEMGEAIVTPIPNET